MSEITTASAEQSAGIEQIHQSIGQMDRATQQNAALVEEAAGAAQSLQERAGSLARQVSIFKLAGHKAVQAAVPPAHPAVQARARRALAA